jgi:GDP/UDP-N,N'-diacetylbacillosamine 2-epimerase (hydrolysing)
MSRKICVVTGSRAEYGLLQPVMEGISAASDCQLQVIATGMHLSPEFGLTYREIENAGFNIDRKVEMLLSSDTPAATGKSMGLGLIGFTDALQELSPDLLVLLGDRFEIFAAAAAALVAKIPIAHIHGGETTEGAFDEALRHSISKMSHLHFVAAEAYRQRVIQLGEHPDRVFLVGGLGVDNIKRLRLMDKVTLERELGFKFAAHALLVTFHPATLDDSSSALQMTEVLAALDALSGVPLIFTMPNADAGGRGLRRQIEQFVESRSNAHAFTSLGQLRYLSCLQFVDGVVGNSSSGLTEVPTFRKATINIGDRQRGRLKAESVIDCEPQRSSISAAIALMYSEPFQARLRSVRNPYGEGGASEAITRVLCRHPLGAILKKSFYDLSQ